MTDHLWAQESVGADLMRTVVPFSSRKKRWRAFLRNSRATWCEFEGDNRTSMPESTIGVENQGLGAPISIDNFVSGAGILLSKEQKPLSHWKIYNFCRSKLPGGGTLNFQICLVVAEQSSLVVAYWSSRSARWQEIGLPRWWCIDVPFGGSRLDWPGCGAVKFQIYWVATDRTCPVVAHWRYNFFPLAKQRFGSGIIQYE